jgi:hypothetical protein
MKLIRKGDDVSLAILEKIRAAPWKVRTPNVRQIIRRCEERDDPWENIPQEDDCTSDVGRHFTAPSEHPSGRPTCSLVQTQLLRRQGDLPDWEDLIGSSLEELKTTYPDQYEGTVPIPQNVSRPGTVNTQEALKLMRTLHYDPEGRQPTNAYFDALSRSGNDILATEGRKIIRNIVEGGAESMALRGWIHRLNTTTGDNNIRKKITVTTQNLGPSGIFRVMHVIVAEIHWLWGP